MVITPDLRSDAGWKELRHLPLALGLTAAWSVPIVGAGGRVLGTFGTYFRKARQPRPEEDDSPSVIELPPPGLT